MTIRTATSIGIIVLQNRDGKGGNIVIHPSVTNLAGTLVAERVLLSGVEYGGSLEIHDGTTDEALLANQLHIFGNLLSENTIGGSVATTPQCPYYVEQGDCLTAIQAQSFDLNFLRRFRMDIYGNPAHGGMIAGGGTCSG